MPGLAQRSMAADKDTPGGANGAEQNLPGEPVPSDAIDPELIALPRAKARVGRVLAASVIALSVFLLAKLWPDFRFSRDETPERFDTPAELLSQGAANSFVTVPAITDLTVGAVVRKGKGEYGHRIRPVLGTNGRLWVMTHSYHWHAAPAYDYEVSGRLAILGELPFYDQLLQWWKKSPDARRVVEPTALRAALENSASEIEVAGGDRVSLQPNTELELHETVPTKVAVTTYYTEDRPDEAAWTLTLSNLGLAIDGGRAQGQGASGETFIYEVTHPGGVAAVRELLEQKRIYAARAEPVVNKHTVMRSDLRASADGLAIADAAALPWSSLDLLRVVSAYPLTEDARVIIATDRPQDYWHVSALMLALLLAALLFAFIIVRPLAAELLRSRKTQPKAS